MAGIKLRMPPGEFWQFLGQSLGANPTPMAYAEVYTALQTGAIDGQDNPLVADGSMKFYEVTSQFVLTNHVVGYDILAVSKKAWEPEARSSRRRSRRPPTRPSTRAPRSTTRRRGGDRVLQGGRQASLHARPERLPRPSRRRSISTNTAKSWPKGTLEQHQRGQVEALPPAEVPRPRPAFP